MKAVSVRELKNNPSAALRSAREDPVMVLNRHQPEALLIHLSDDLLLSETGMRQAIATSLFRDGSLSLGLAARFSRLAVAEFIDHVSRLGIPVVEGTVETARDEVVITKGAQPHARHVPVSESLTRETAPLAHLDLPDDLFDTEDSEQSAIEAGDFNDSLGIWRGRSGDS